MVQPNLAVLADDGGRTRLRVKDGVLLINRRMGQIEYETSGVFGIGGRHDQFPLSEVGPVCMKTESDADGDLWQEVFLMPEAEGVKPIRLYYEQLSPPETSDARVNKGGDTCRRACELARDLAERLGVDICDQTYVDPLRLSPESLSEPMLAQWAHDPPQLSNPQPGNDRFRCSTVDGELVVAEKYRWSDTPWWAWVVLLLVSPFLLLLSPFLVVSAFFPYRLRVSPRQVRTTGAASSGPCRAILADDMLDVGVIRIDGKRHQLVVRSVSGHWLRFGANLTRADAEWLRDVVIRVLARNGDASPQGCVS